MSLRTGLVAAFVFGVFIASIARSAEIEGVQFADQHQLDGELLNLNGVGLLRYRVLFKGYVAALYLGEQATAQQVLGDIPRRLELEYFWSIPAEAFAQATREGISRNVDAPTLERLEPRIERLNALYQDVAPGDRYAITYLPGIGTELSLNGESKGIIEGADFARALFSIWLGEEPIDEALRAKLLTRG